VNNALPRLGRQAVPALLLLEEPQLAGPLVLLHGDTPECVGSIALQSHAEPALRQVSLLKQPAEFSERPHRATRLQPVCHRQAALLIGHPLRNAQPTSIKKDFDTSPMNAKHTKFATCAGMQRVEYRHLPQIPGTMPEALEGHRTQGLAISLAPGQCNPKSQRSNVRCRMTG
jgi:hypothetical protein